MPGGRGKSIAQQPSEEKRGKNWPGKAWVQTEPIDLSAKDFSQRYWRISLPGPIVVDAGAAAGENVINNSCPQTQPQPAAASLEPKQVTAL